MRELVNLEAQIDFMQANEKGNQLTIQRLRGVVSALQSSVTEKKLELGALNEKLVECRKTSGCCDKTRPSRPEDTTKELRKRLAELKFESSNAKSEKERCNNWALHIEKDAEID